MQPQSPHGPSAEYNQGTGNWDIDAVVIYGKMDWSGRLWFMNNRLKYLSSTLSYQPYSTSTSSSGGGGNSNGTSSSPVPTFFAERLLLHYMSRKGTDYKLTKEEFNYSVEKGKPICDEWASEAPDLHKVIVSYYGVDFDLEHGFGTASIFYTDMNGFLNPMHFRDYYNFDHKKAGDRDPSAERKTHWGSYIPGVGFWIKYP